MPRRKQDSQREFNVPQSTSPIPREWDRVPRSAFWEELNLLDHDGISDLHETNAVVFAFGEDTASPIKGTSLVNHYSVQIGRSDHFVSRWHHIHDHVSSVYGFTAEHDWKRQRHGLEELFFRFFKSNALQSGSLGWVSLITAQRPQPLRSWEDSRIAIATRQVDIAQRGVPIGGASTIDIAGASLSSNTFCLETAGALRRHRLRRMVFGRELSAKSWLSCPRHYSEWRQVPAIDGEHDDILRRGRIPGMGESYYAGRRLIGATGFLNLCRVQRTVCGELVMYDNTLEIHPESGRIVTIRGFRIPVAVGVLGASVVEHTVLCSALKDLL